MHTFMDYLCTFQALSPATKTALQQALKIHFYKPGTFLRREGELSDKIYFIRKGLVHVYRAKEGRKKTEWLVGEQQLACPYNRFIKQETSAVIYETLEISEVHVLPYRDYVHLCRFSDFRSLTSLLLVDALYRINGFLVENKGEASDRYNKFLEYFPGLANRLPVNIIASLLDVCPKTISRIRSAKITRRRIPKERSRVYVIHPNITTDCQQRQSAI